jgi:hypothetical protein
MPEDGPGRTLEHIDDQLELLAIAEREGLLGRAGCRLRGTGRARLDIERQRVVDRNAGEDADKRQGKPREHAAHAWNTPNGRRLVRFAAGA